jgi:hypothetical protein
MKTQPENCPDPALNSSMMAGLPLRWPSAGIKVLYHIGIVALGWNQDSGLGDPGGNPQKSPLTFQ